MACPQGWAPGVLGQVWTVRRGEDLTAKSVCTGDPGPVQKAWQLAGTPRPPSLGPLEQTSP